MTGGIPTMECQRVNDDGEDARVGNEIRIREREEGETNEIVKFPQPRQLRASKSSRRRRYEARAAN